MSNDDAPDRFSFKDETGNTHGVWVVVRREVSHNGARWRCRCTSCGHERVMYGFTLRANPPKCRHPKPPPVLT